MTVALGSDDAIKIWCGDELVLERDVRRPAQPDQDTATLHLRPGKNVLLVKLVNYGGPGALYFRVRGEETQSVPAPIVRAICMAPAERTADQRRRVRHFYRRAFSARWRELEARVTELSAQHRKRLDAMPRTMIMQERAERRPAHFLNRGQYDDKGERVSAGVPGVLPPLAAREGRRARPAGPGTLARRPPPTR